ncbi:MAG: thermonuclease family protein [Pirellulaceae bacterium]|nr:thermonuclease family protein [Pirellulaceae bacterium]
MRRFRRYPSRSVWVCIFVCALVAGRYGWDRGASVVPHAAEGSSLSGSLVAGEFEVVRVDRADLLLVRQQVPVLGKDAPLPLEAPLQLLGVRTLELSAEGGQFTSEFLSKGTPSLDLDRRRLDSAGHYLAYVYADGRLLNEELIRAGLAQADLYPGDNQTMHRNLVQAEKEAKRASRGIWAKPTSGRP